MRDQYGNVFSIVPLVHEFPASRTFTPKRYLFACANFNKKHDYVEFDWDGVTDPNHAEAHAERHRAYATLYGQGVRCDCGAPIIMEISDLPYQPGLTDAEARSLREWAEKNGVAKTAPSDAAMATIAADAIWLRAPFRSWKGNDCFRMVDGEVTYEKISNAFFYWLKGGQASQSVAYRIAFDDTQKSRDDITWLIRVGQIYGFQNVVASKEKYEIPPHLGRGLILARVEERNVYQLRQVDGLMRWTCVPGPAPFHDSTSYDSNPVTKDQPMSTHANPPKTLEILKTDATDAAWRTAGKQFIRLARDPLVAALSRNLAPGDDAVRAQIAAFLGTEAGEAMLTGMLSMALMMVPGASEIPARLARELRVSSMANAGDLVLEVVMEPLRKLLAMGILGDAVTAATTGVRVEAVDQAPAIEPEADIHIAANGKAASREMR